MRTVKVFCPDEVNKELARLNYELEMANTVIDRFIDRHLLDADALDSPIFERWATEVAEKTAAYEEMKNYVTNVVLEGISEHEAMWNLDFNTSTITVKILCDCNMDEWLERVSGQ